MIVGIVVITGLGAFTLYTTRTLNGNTVLLEEVLNQNKIIFLIGIIIYVLISVLVAYFVTKNIIKPTTKLIKSAEEFMSDSENRIEFSAAKPSNEIDGLANAFSLMTKGIKENLNEVTRQKKQMEAILVNMTDGIIAFNIDGEIMHINPAATSFLGLSENDNTFEKIFKKISIDMNMEKIIYLEDWTSSEQKVNINGKYLNMFFATYKDENDRPGGVLVVVQDITEHVRLDNMRKEFVADVSHELKTPITSIMGYADTLLEGEYEKEVQARFLNVIASESRRMAKLVNDLLTLSKYDTAQVKQEKVEFDLGELVKKCEEKLEIEVSKKNLNAECFVTANVPLVYADIYGIERVVLNILTNSIKYTPEGGKIKIYVGFVYNNAYIKIIDTGIGIPEKDIDKIFERFYRVDKARTREMGGTGLGLSIAKEILEQNNGSIDIKSIVGEGTEVVIQIPIKQ
jgi:two-component system sensor histidine kinase VicK